MCLHIWAWIGRTFGCDVYQCSRCGDLANKIPNSTTR